MFLFLFLLQDSRWQQKGQEEERSVLDGWYIVSQMIGNPQGKL
jgi:hypothetical protein